MGGTLGKVESPKKDFLPEARLEAKIVEAMKRRVSSETSVKSFNSVILKFPKIDDSFRKFKATFEEFDEDKNGAIDHEELRRCFHKLEISLREEEIDDLFKACDINDDMGINFNEFIVLLCLIYLLDEGSTSSQSKSRIGVPYLEATFETLLDAFALLDKNKDGYVSSSEMINAISESSKGERSSGQIALRRFEEMDWDKNGMVNFKEFLFAFTRWVGIDEAEDEDEG
ncbi:hypothetical protein Droror1_Dr00014615 [Drosera rotundifolia]